MRAGGAVVAAGALVATQAMSTNAVGATQARQLGVAGGLSAARSYGKYNVRLRYGRLPGYCGLWLRVSELGNADTAIPFQLLVSTTPDMASLISSSSFYANPTSSFIVRTKVRTQGLPRIYVQVRLVGNPRIVSHVWTIHRHGPRTLRNG